MVAPFFTLTSRTAYILHGVGLPHLHPHQQRKFHLYITI